MANLIPFGLSEEEKLWIDEAHRRILDLAETLQLDVIQREFGAAMTAMYAGDRQAFEKEIHRLETRLRLKVVRRD